MAVGALAPAFWFTALSDTGIPLPGAKFYFYLSGTLTPATVYQDADLNTAYPFPAEADSAGRIVVYLDPAVGNLKLIMTDENDVPVGPTVDPIEPNQASLTDVGSVFDFGANSAAVVANTSYDSGATFDKLHPGSSPWLIDSATLPGTYVLEVVGVQRTAGTLTVALVNLTDGSPDTPIATAAITSLTGERAVSSPITFAAGGASKLYGIKAQVSANSGFVIGARILRTA